MKNSLKLLFVAFTLLFSASCIEMAVGGAVVAGGNYVAKQGYIEDYFDRGYDSCWQVMEDFVSSIDGEITYHSQNEGLIKIDFTEGGSGKFKIEKLTNRATKVSLRCFKLNFPSNDLATAYFEPLAEKLN